MGMIVVGVDGSEHAQRALRWAIGEARTHESRIIAVHAWLVPVSTYGPGIEPVILQMEEFERAEQLVLDRSIEEVRGEAEAVEIEGRLLEAPTVDALVDTAKEEHADLLVVGSRGLGGFKALLLGSVSSAVAHHTPVPLAIIPPPDRK